MTSETPTFGRCAEIPYDQMTPEQKDAYDTIIKARGRLPGPVKIWIHNPKLAKVVSAFGVHFQPGGYSLTEREREIAVCVITSHWHSAYPTAAHERRAKEIGLPVAAVEAIIGAMPTAFDDEREQIVYEMATVLSDARWVPRGLYQRAVKALGHVGITDVITLMGHYSRVAMTLAFYDVPDGATGIQRWSQAHRLDYSCSEVSRVVRAIFIALGCPCDSNFFGQACRTRAASLVLWERTNARRKGHRSRGMRKIFQERLARH